MATNVTSHPVGGRIRRAAATTLLASTTTLLAAATTLLAAATTLAILPGIARAHGVAGHGGTPVAPAVAVGLPVLAGLAGGLLALRYRHTATAARHGERVGLGALLLVLGATLALSALARSPALGVAGVAAGVASVAVGPWATRSADTAAASRRGHHAGVALGAVCGHRAVEGVVVGALVVAGASVGLVGAVVVAGHGAVETAAVAGLAGPSRRRAVAAAVAVQAGYVAGAVVGLGVASAVPPAVQTVALALAGGVLVAVGATETGHATSAIRGTTQS